jgi:hypothetical protein
MFSLAIVDFNRQEAQEALNFFFNPDNQSLDLALYNSE